MNWPTKIRDEKHMIELIVSRLVRVGECDVYQGTRCRKGYGRIEVAGKARAVHRAIWAWANGPIPDGALVCHRCDNTSCARLEHLFLGSNDENMADMMRKGRSRGPGRLRGERNPSSKNSDAEVKAMREKFASGHTLTELVAEYGLSRNGVWQLVKGSTRLEAGGPIAPKAPRRGSPREPRTGYSKAALIAAGAISTDAPIHPQPVPLSQLRPR
jgi:hypothetical protein